MARTDRASKVIAAPLERVFDALVDRAALETWLPPGDMTGRFERFDPRPGGSYRLVLTYTDSPSAGGKSSAGSDIVEARYVDIVPDVRVVQAVDFESDDPAFAGTMTMAWAVEAVDGGTRVEITAADVPEGISAVDHAEGMRSSLDKLAGYVTSAPLGAGEVAEAYVRYLVGDGDALVALMAEDFHDHVSGRSGRAIWSVVQGWLEDSFSDRTCELIAALADGDRIVVWLVLRGVHVGSGFPWLRDRPPSGRQVAWAQVHMFRTADGLLSEHWAVRDDLRVLEAIDEEDAS